MKRILAAAVAVGLLACSASAGAEESTSDTAETLEDLQGVYAITIGVCERHMTRSEADAALRELLGPRTYQGSDEARLNQGEAKSMAYTEGRLYQEPQSKEKCRSMLRDIRADIAKAKARETVR